MPQTDELRHPLLSGGDFDSRERNGVLLQNLHSQFRTDIRNSEELLSVLRPGAINEFLSATETMPTDKAYSTLEYDLSQVKEPDCCDSQNCEDATLVCGVTTLGLVVGGGIGAVIGMAAGGSCCIIGLGATGGVFGGVIGGCIAGNITEDEPTDDAYIRASEVAKRARTQVATIYGLFSPPIDAAAPQRQSMEEEKPSNNRLCC